MHTLVEGEVATVTYHTSGHLYFSIKDDKSSMKCVMWRSSVAKMKFRIEKGMHIVVEGSVSVYTPRGEYQFQTVRIEPYGQGALALAYEQLKKKLKEQGYFDTSRKKPIPKHIHKIALVTAKDSAALHDMLKIIEKRWRALDVTIIDTLVQGEQAKVQIAHALRYADSLNVDVVVLGRGGGSAEDLWAFNEEVVAQALYEMQTPTVSAVGHEVDTLISDFVADLRAPTPSAAMEMILPDMAEIQYGLDEISTRYRYSLEQNMQKKVEALKHLEELVLRASPFLRLVQIDETFRAQKNELKRMLENKIEYFSAKIPEIKNVYKERIKLKMQDKERYLALLNEKVKLSNPKLNCHEGWAQISYMGKKVSLDSLEIEKTFILEDESMRVEALCLRKEKS